LIEQRLVIERVEMTRSALHEQKDDVPGPADALRNLFCRFGKRGHGAKHRLPQHGGERDSAEAASGGAQELPARGDRIEIVTGHLRMKQAAYGGMGAVMPASGWAALPS
jgi:hypothetical protein